MARDSRLKQGSPTDLRLRGQQPISSREAVEILQALAPMWLDPWKHPRA
jgi:hypothetical protein